MAGSKDRAERESKKEKVKKSERTKAEVKKSEASTDKRTKKSRKHGTVKPDLPVTLSLLADSQAVDPNLSSLFAAKPAPVQPRNLTLPDVPDSEEEEESQVVGEDDDSAEEGNHQAQDVTDIEVISVNALDTNGEHSRKRKRRDVEDNLEDAYMKKLAREEEKDAKRQKDESKSREDGEDSTGGEDIAEKPSTSSDIASDNDEEMMSPPPKHETQQVADDEVAKANRTVFLGNVSTTAINSKTARKTLMNHLASFFTTLPSDKSDDTKHSVESLRFRSTPYSSGIPKKAAFAKKELMDATTKSTNAYVVYSSPMLSREAAKHLNGTIVLDRHLRVDEVAHPAKVDHRRCVFVGNLGFVDDESNIQDANEEEGRETRKRSKIPADAEEGLWRTFGKCGKVESVRVIRDSTTRVGKGIAYVQFEDENVVEAALLLNEKKFPPMLPRKLRVSRAKAQKKNAKIGSGRPSARPSIHGYQRKVTDAELTQMGRAGKLLGRAAAAQAVKTKGRPTTSSIPIGMKKPEDFIFEGHRASSKSGKSGLKLGKKGKSKPTNRSAQRGAAYKAKKRA